MATWRGIVGVLLGTWILGAASWASPAADPVQEGAGSIRGIVYDDDFDAPLPLALVRVVETGQEVRTSEQGNYVFAEVAPGTYTLVFSKDGYVRQIRTGVVVGSGRLTDVDARLAGDYVEMEEFVVQEVLQLDPGSEEALLELRFDSPGLLDAISSELLGRAGASDAADALTLVSGATVQEGKFAVVRGLPDRYVSSQLNGVRLPSADEETRAVELDQFPSAVIESINVTKTFTPDQQGDASGGAVDVRLKSIPDQTLFKISTQYSWDSQATGSDFLSYQGGGFDFWGDDDGNRVIQPTGRIDGPGRRWDGAVGVSEDEAPDEYKFSAAFGGKRDLPNGIRIGGLASFFYERDATFVDDGINDSYYVKEPTQSLEITPELIQEDTIPKTKLFDVVQGSQSVQWGGLGSVGFETENNSLGLTYLYTKTTEDVATLSEDTRGKAFFFPGYDPDDPEGIGNTPADRDLYPYIRTETLEFTERTTSSLQLRGTHVLPYDGLKIAGLEFGEPELDWTISVNDAALDQPDKRQFGEYWLADSFNPGAPPFEPPFTDPATHFGFKPAANFLLGNLQRVFKTIDEESEQGTINLKLPFERRREDGYLKFGYFSDKVDREFRQETFSNFNDQSNYEAPFEDKWSDVFPDQVHRIQQSLFDIDYDGEIDIEAYYGMIDLPVTKSLSMVTGARVEDTTIRVFVTGEENARWFPPGHEGNNPVRLGDGDADIPNRHESSILPSLGFIYEATDELTLRTSYSQTIARPTFRELTPIVQQEFLGGPIFIGNPEVELSSLQNLDFRVDYEPYAGGLISASYFYKDLDDPIEFVQRFNGFVYTTAENYPEGTLSGFEFEVRQDLGELWKSWTGVGVGVNATFIDSEVTLTPGEIEDLEDAGVGFDKRDATNAPEHLYNIFLTYDLEETRTQLGLFYTVRGDTLVAGATAAGGPFVPNIYEEEYGTLNFSINQRLGEHWAVGLKAKNLTNPAIKEVYRSDFTEDVTRSSYTKGIEVSFGLSFTN